MKTQNFCFWLQGFFELDNSEEISKEQVVKIKERLHSCFIHEAESIVLEDYKSKTPLNTPKHP